MDELRIWKYHGTGNDFVMLEDLEDERPLDPRLVAALCDRHLGVGADGVIRVTRGVEPGTDFFMDYRNADGSLAEMCGNGIRVFAQYLYDAGLVPADEPARIATRAGVKTVSREGDLFSADIGEAAILGETKVSVGDRSWPATHVVVGNPHAEGFYASCGFRTTGTVETRFGPGLVMRREL